MPFNKFPEVHSLEESMQILDKYKPRLSREDYENIAFAIRNQAHEDLYCNEDDIIGMVEIAEGKMTADEAIAKIIAKIKELKEKGEIY